MSEKYATMKLYNKYKHITASIKEIVSRYNRGESNGLGCVIECEQFFDYGLKKAVERVFNVLLKMIEIIRNFVAVLGPKCVNIFLDQILENAGSYNE